MKIISVEIVYQDDLEHTFRFTIDIFNFINEVEYFKPFVFKNDFADRSKWESGEMELEIKDAYKYAYHHIPVYGTVYDEVIKIFNITDTYQDHSLIEIEGKSIDGSFYFYISWAYYIDLEITKKPISNIGIGYHENNNGEKTEQKYLIQQELVPSTFPNIQTAAKGQTIIVKEVDENNVPTAWETTTFPTKEELISEIIAALPKYNGEVR